MSSATVIQVFGHENRVAADRARGASVTGADRRGLSRSMAWWRTPGRPAARHGWPAGGESRGSAGKKPPGRPMLRHFPPRPCRQVRDARSRRARLGASEGTRGAARTISAAPARVTIGLANRAHNFQYMIVHERCADAAWSRLHDAGSRRSATLREPMPVRPVSGTTCAR